MEVDARVGNPSENAVSEEVSVRILCVGCTVLTEKTSNVCAWITMCSVMVKCNYVITLYEALHNISKHPQREWKTVVHMDSFTYFSMFSIASHVDSCCFHFFGKLLEELGKSNVNQDCNRVHVEVLHMSQKIIYAPMVDSFVAHMEDCWLPWRKALWYEYLFHYRLLYW